MSQRGKTIHSSNILYVSLRMIPQILSVSENYYRNYKNSSFKYFSFVARVQCKEEGNWIFNDTTATFSYTPKIKQNLSHLKINSYYQCLCVLKNYDKFFKIEMESIKLVDGNAITNHIIRVITGQIKRKIWELKEPQVREEKDHHVVVDELYVEMKEWSIEKGKFTVEDLRQKFKGSKQDEFNQALQKMEEEQIVGNMGEYYEYL